MWGDGGTVWAMLWGHGVGLGYSPGCGIATHCNSCCGCVNHKPSPALRRVLDALGHQRTVVFADNVGRDLWASLGLLAGRRGEIHCTRGEELFPGGGSREETQGESQDTPGALL